MEEKHHDSMTITEEGGVRSNIATADTDAGRAADGNEDRLMAQAIDRILDVEETVKRHCARHRDRWIVRDYEMARKSLMADRSLTEEALHDAKDSLWCRSAETVDARIACRIDRAGRAAARQARLTLWQADLQSIRKEITEGPRHPAPAVNVVQDKEPPPDWQTLARQQAEERRDT